jgi:hypothetical protein
MTQQNALTTDLDQQVYNMNKTELQTLISQKQEFAIAASRQSRDNRRVDSLQKSIS